MAARSCLVGASLFFGLTACATNAAADPAVTAASPSPIEQFQAKEARLFEIGYRLGTANASYCDNGQPSLGLLLHDVRAYGQAEAIRSLLGLRGDIGVQAVAQGSPAQLAGIRQNDTLLAIDGQEIEDRPDTRKDWQRAAKLRDTIDASAGDGSVMLAWIDASGTRTEATLLPVSSCASTFELLSGDDGAAADGTRVLVGESFPGFAYTDEEFAAVLAHEMAHNLLGHIPYLAENGKGDMRARNSERDADRLMPWLLANAGYDPAAATRMMQRFGPRHGGGLLRRRTHDGWDERVEFIATEVSKIEKFRQEITGLSVDWRTNFEPFLKID
ncbi:PDZ domain-containing protein [Qipengyuania sphaerica]|uniref:PDZ domain-containing protein n=1 Tax=Qipengyuania sphaerica TaxID=2867243 RepID=UPI001C8710C7|nr:PDZ domain-containing protein [Qipengyuania sphaerica]MBX7540810.1 hypothetical protein [Qipengyuania sphaerica]